MTVMVPSSSGSSVFGARSGVEAVAVIAQGYGNRDYYDEEEVGYDSKHMMRDEGGRRGGRRRGDREEGGGLQLVKNPKQVGAVLIGLGLMLTVMGMMLFFEGNLLRLGNICIISGIPFLIGMVRVKNFFVKPERLQASIMTAAGIALVFMGKPRMGILCEVFGILNLFGNMFPLLLAVGKRMPIVGDILSAFDGSTTSKKRYRPEI